MGKGQEVIICLLLAIGVGAILYSLDSKKYPMNHISTSLKGFIACITGILFMILIFVAIGIGLGADSALGFVTALLSIF